MVDVEKKVKKAEKESLQANVIFFRAHNTFYLVKKAAISGETAAN